MSENIYEFDAGDLCLDFANTMNWHASQHPIEGLPGYTDLLMWGKAAGLLNPESEKRLQEIAREKPGKSDEYHRYAIQVREAIYRIFSHHYAGQPIPPDDLVLLNSIVREAMAHRQLVQSGNEFQWSWSPDIDGINLIIWPVAFSAAHLLASPTAARVRECEDDRGCGYLFIDQSKNHSRRWCSMESCGNRAKARRHYSRVQA
jgi:predicted RNA-binding Zn ribbon-like protein